MQRIVVDKKLNIFDYIVDFAVKQHNQPEEEYPFPRHWNIAKNSYKIKFYGKNGRYYRCFMEKSSRKPCKHSIAQILEWRKGNDDVKMSVTYYCQKYNHVRKKRRYLSVNYIVVNGEQVFKCRPCANPPEPDSWRYWFQY